MSDKPSKEEIHKYFASNLFNSTWDLIDKPERTEDEEFNMIHSAHASLYHWTQAGGPEQIYVGEWQVSRVYSVLKMFDSGFKHGLRSLKICQDNKFTGFNLAYAYEAIARAYSIIPDNDKVKEFINKAKEESSNIKEADSKKMLLDDLENIPVI